MVIVTAADQTYFGGLINLIGSIHFWNPEVQVMVYDLGLESRLCEEIGKWRNVTFVPGFLLRDLPSHCRKLNVYAWKAFVIQDALAQHETILWLDAGTDLRSSILPIQLCIQQQGYFFVQGQDVDMTLRSHDACYDSLGLIKHEFSGKPHYAGAVQGYVRNSEIHVNVLNKLVEFSAREECIAPPGSNLSNHRYDQTLLSIILYRLQTPVLEQTRFLASDKKYLNKDPFAPSEKIIFTGRARYRDYSFQVRDTQGGYLYGKPINSQ